MYIFNFLFTALFAIWYKIHVNNNGQYNIQMWHKYFLLTRHSIAEVRLI